MPSGRVLGAVALGRFVGRFVGFEVGDDGPSVTQWWSTTWAMQYPEWIARFRELLAVARDVSPEMYRHEQQFTPVPADDIAAFEREHALSLPAEFREFIQHVGVGGGPYGGLPPLGDHMPRALPQILVTVTSKDGSISTSAGTGPRPPLTRPPVLGRPFPFAVDTWYVGEPLPLGHDEHPYDGCFLLDDQGCGYFDFLVLTGPRAGEIWCDTSAAYEGGAIAALGVQFRAWIEDWVTTFVRNGIVSEAYKALDANAPSERHELIARYESLVTVSEDPLVIAERGAVDLYLGRRAAAEGALAQLEAQGPRASASGTALRRWLFRAELAAAQGKDPSSMAALLEHPCVDVRVAVARNPVTPPELLEGLATDPDARVRLALARHPSMPWAVLVDAFEDALAQWESSHADHGRMLFELEAIVRRPEATPAIADALASLVAGAVAPWTVRAAALSPAISIAKLADLATHAQPVVRQAVALQPRTETKVLRQLARDDHWAVRHAVAARPDLSPDLLAQLARDKHEEVRAMIARHPSVTEEILARLATDESSGVLSAVLGAKRLPGAVRESLATHPWKPIASSLDLFGCWLFTTNGTQTWPLFATSASVIAGGAYSHPAYPESMLAPHFHEQYGMGGYTAASHPFLASHTIAALGRESYGYTRSTIARRDDVPPGTLEVLAADKLAMVRAAAAENSLLPAARWTELATEKVEEVRQGAALNPRAPAEGLARLAKDPAPYVRRAVLMNQGAPAALRATLARDPDPEVSKWAPLVERS